MVHPPIAPGRRGLGVQARQGPPAPRGLAGRGLGVQLSRWGLRRSHVPFAIPRDLICWLLARPPAGSTFCRQTPCRWVLEGEGVWGEERVWGGEG